jgi:hypothetical protein
LNLTAGGGTDATGSTTDLRENRSPVFSCMLLYRYLLHLAMIGVMVVNVEKGES